MRSEANGTAPVSRQPAGGGKAWRTASRGGVGVAGRGQRAEGAGDAGGEGVELLDVVEGDVALGQRARLVEADHVDAGQALDRRQLADEDAAAGQCPGRGEEGHAGQQDQSLGNDADQAGHGALDALLPRLSRPALGEEEDGRGDDDGDGHVREDAVDAGHQLRRGGGVTAGFLGHAAGEGGGAHAGHLGLAGAGHHEAAREHRVAGLLGHVLGLAGEQ
ncbi:MAG TPA: hypothetical protein VJ653_06275 [Acidimicrobiales bacterium]|nr:hypothetical protein [Acidimicrobiales bacterium]